MLDQPFARSVLGLDGSEGSDKGKKRRKKSRASRDAPAASASVPTWLQSPREQAATAAAAKKAAAKKATATAKKAAAAKNAAAKKAANTQKKPAAAAAPPQPPAATAKDDDDEDDGDEAMCEGEDGAGEEEVQDNPDEEVDETLIDGALEAHQIGEYMVRLNRRRSENITIIQIKAPGCSWSQLAQFTDKLFQKETRLLETRGCTARQMADTAAKACCVVCVVVVFVAHAALVRSKRSSHHIASK